MTMETLGKLKFDLYNKRSLPQKVNMKIRVWNESLFSLIDSSKLLF